jgi:dUTP pyrophosphatase
MAPAEVAVAVVRLPHAAGLPLPAYATAGSSGMDLCAALEAPLEIPAGKRAIVPTGLTIAIPEGFEAQVRPRSGLALKHGLMVLNTPGTVDADYRGEIRIILANLGEEPFAIQRGDRIAQLVIAPVCQARWTEVGTLPDSARGTGGFGHTGR